MPDLIRILVRWGDEENCLCFRGVFAFQGVHGGGYGPGREAKPPHLVRLDVALEKHGWGRQCGEVKGRGGQGSKCRPINVFAIHSRIAYRRQRVRCVDLGWGMAASSFRRLVERSPLG